MGSTPFDRIADRYDETRGGLERGGGLAREIAPHLRPGAVAEIGVGTAAVALPLARLDHPVVGIDLSAPMLHWARERLGARVARADGYHLPLPGGAVPNAVLVWVLQLVPDDRWAAVVEPAVAALRALPEPSRPCERRTHYDLLVFDRP